MMGTLTQNDIDTAKSILADVGNANRVADMYIFLIGKGFNYPKLALGLVNGSSPSGLTASDFMKLTAERQKIKGAGLELFSKPNYHHTLN